MFSNYFSESNNLPKLPKLNQFCIVCFSVSQPFKGREALDTAKNMSGLEKKNILYDEMLLILVFGGSAPRLLRERLWSRSSGWEPLVYFL